MRMNFVTHNSDTALLPLNYSDCRPSDPYDEDEWWDDDDWYDDHLTDDWEADDDDDYDYFPDDDVIDVGEEV